MFSGIRLKGAFVPQYLPGHFSPALRTSGDGREVFNGIIVSAFKAASALNAINITIDNSQMAWPRQTAMADCSWRGEESFFFNLFFILKCFFLFIFL